MAIQGGRGSMSNRRSNMLKCFKIVPLICVLAASGAVAQNRSGPDLARSGPAIHLDMGLNTAFRPWIGAVAGLPPHVAAFLSQPNDGQWLELSGSYSHGLSGWQDLVSTRGLTQFTIASGQTNPAQIALSADVDGMGARAGGTILLGLPGQGGLLIDSTAFTPAGLASSISQFAQSEAALGGALLVLSTVWTGTAEGSTAAAYGVVIDGSGTRIEGSGDLNADLLHSATETHSQQSQSANLAWPISQGDGWILAGRVGPVFQTRQQTGYRGTSVSVGTAPDLPLVLVAHQDQVQTRYSGAMIGLGLERNLSDRWSLAADVGLGLATYRSRHGQYDLSRLGGRTMYRPAEMASHQGLAHPARLSINLIHRPSPKTSLQLGVTADYNSAVPVLRALPDGSSRFGTQGKAEWSFNLQYVYRF